MGEQGVQDGTYHTTLRGPRVEVQSCGCIFAYPPHLGASCQEELCAWSKGNSSFFQLYLHRGPAGRNEVKRISVLLH